VGDKLPPALSAGTNGITDGHSWWQCLFQTGWGIDNLLKMSGRWWSGGGVEAASGSQGGLHDMVVVCKQLVMGGGYFGIQCSGEEMVKCCLGFLAR